LTLIHAIILGIIQGLTEFLPISSTAHLTVAEKRLLGDPMPLAFDVLMHVGTLAAVVTYFWGDVLRVVKGALGRDAEGLRLLWLLFLAMIPTGVLAIATMPMKESAKSHLWVYGVCLLLTAPLLWGAAYVAKRRQGRAIPGMNALDALCIGAIQGLGGGFGLSRSGSTISIGVFRGMGLPEATRFSFLLGIPTILAAALVEGRHLISSHAGAAAQSVPLLPSIVGVLAAGVSGYFAIGLLDRLVRHQRLGGFALYCAIFGAAVVMFGLR
jgi:undecaprenyl-diphosphatase